MVLTRSDQKHTQGQKKTPVSTQTDTKTLAYRMWSSILDQTDHKDNVAQRILDQTDHKATWHRECGHLFWIVAQRMWSSLFWIKLTTKQHRTENVVTYLDSNGLQRQSGTEQ